MFGLVSRDLVTYSGHLVICTRVITSGSFRQAEHVGRMEKQRNTYRILIPSPIWTRLLYKELCVSHTVHIRTFNT